MMALRTMPTARAVRPRRGHRIEVSIWDLLVWAFQVEKVSLDFDELASVSGERPGIGTEWLLMQRGAVGCVIDGGGRSDPHPDAELVASALANLPEGCGGRDMALVVAHCARLGQWPDFRDDVQPRCEPVGWTRCRAGRVARREYWRGPGMWPPSMLRRSTAYADGYVCPVTHVDPVFEIAEARRHWLTWWLALFDLRTTFQHGSPLSAFVVTDVMPPRRPWVRMAEHQKNV